jgi:hypothetical protein
MGVRERVASGSPSEDTAGVGGGGTASTSGVVF